MLNMENEFNYIKEWRDLILKASEALNKKNFTEYNNIMYHVNDVVLEYQKNSELTYECKNFGISKYIIEEAMPFLFKSRPKVIKEIIDTIKNDKNLLSQFQFFESLKQYNSNLDIKDYINEALSLLNNNINYKTINKSNKKLEEIISKYNLKPSEKIDSNSLDFFENCDYLIKNKKKLSNLSLINESFNNVANYTKEHYNKINKKDNIFNNFQLFEDKYTKLLNDDEKKYLRNIINNDTNSKEKIFNDLKCECINKINDLINDSNENEKNSLNEIKDEINNKEFNENTLVTDISKLLEIKEILFN